MLEINTIYKLMQNLIPVKDYKKALDNNDFLIITTKSLTIFYLNETAKDFYQLIDEKRTIHEITDKLKEVYSVDEKTLINDIINLIRDLQWKNLIFFKEIKNEKI